MFLKVIVNVNQYILKSTINNTISWVGSITSVVFLTLTLISIDLDRQISISVKYFDYLKKSHFIL